MTTQKKLSLVDVIHRTANHAVEDVGPLLKYLDFKPEASDLTSLCSTADRRPPAPHGQQ